jgi:hypothetical protein
MMKEEFTDIEGLLERFFEGKTSNAEEKELYVFFNRKDVPEHLSSYKPLFGYFESGLAEEVHRSETGSSKKPVTVRRRLLSMAISAAAVLLLLLIYPLFINRSADSDPFEGSYIVRNGVRIDNLDEIRPELELTLQKAMLQQEYANRLFEMAASVEDPFAKIQQEIAAHYCELIHQFEDENVRKEVQNMLQVDCKEQL